MFKHDIPSNVYNSEPVAKPFTIAKSLAGCTILIREASSEHEFYARKNPDLAQSLANVALQRTEYSSAL